jgi:hypothetical protein
LADAAAIILGGVRRTVAINVRIKMSPEGKELVWMKVEAKDFAKV